MPKVAQLVSAAETIDSKAHHCLPHYTTQTVSAAQTLPSSEQSLKDIQRLTPCHNGKAGIGTHIFPKPIHAL